MFTRLTFGCSRLCGSAAFLLASIVAILFLIINTLLLLQTVSAWTLPKAVLLACRCHTGMQEEECLQRVRGSVDLVLDTTYCQPQYVFPKQEEVRCHDTSLVLTHMTGRQMHV